jgi:hypothetical protein
MRDSDDLQKISFPAEAAVCSLDRELDFRLQDDQAIEIFEVLLDIYAFGDTRETVAHRVLALGCENVLDLVERELRPYDRDTISKVLAAVRYVARRRAAGGRDHLEVLQRYVGAFLRTGVGLRILDDGTEVAVGDL